MSDADEIEDLCDTVSANLDFALQERTRANAAEATVASLRKQLQEAQNTISCLAASRDRWKAEAKGKISPEWRAIVEAERPVEG